jgi:hypothetical protein
MRYHELMETGDKTAWETFMVYGSFTEPTTGKNFIFIRKPSGRVPWRRKIVPAIERIVGPWFTPEQRDKDKRARERGRERQCIWHVDGDPDPANSMWFVKQPVARYEWNGEALVAVDPPI